MTLTGHVHEFDELRAHALGWRGLLDGLRHALEAAPIEINVRQVKEKFGGLRCYVDFPGLDDLPDDVEHVHSAVRNAHNVTRSAQAAVDAAEGASYLLCYLCGAGATHRGSGYWVRYFCAEHDTQDLYDALKRTAPVAANPPEHGTSGGVLLTEEHLSVLVAEAEAGYDVERLRNAPRVDRDENPEERS